MTILERRRPGYFPMNSRKGTDRAERGESDPVHGIGGCRMNPVRRELYNIGCKINYA